MNKRQILNKCQLFQTIGLLLLLLSITGIGQTTDNTEKQTKANAIYDEAFTLFNKGTAESYKAALDKFQQASRLYQEIDDTSEKAGLSILVSGVISSNLGEKAEALKFFEQALKFFQANKYQNLEATTLNNIGFVYSDLGEKQKALKYYNQSLPLLRQVGDKSGEATTFTNIGGIYVDLGEKQKALEYHNQALLLFRQVGNKSGEAATLTNIGFVYNGLGEKQISLSSANLSHLQSPSKQ